MTIKYLKPTQSQPEIWRACECKLNMKQHHVFYCYYKVSSDKIQEFSYGAISCLFYCINLFITLEIHERQQRHILNSTKYIWGFQKYILYIPWIKRDHWREGEDTK